MAQAAPHAGNLANLGPALRLVESFRIAAEVGGGVRIVATALCHNQDDAQSLAGALRFFAMLAGLKTPNGIHIESSEAQVRIDASIPPETLDRMAGRAAQER